MSGVSEDQGFLERSLNQIRVVKTCLFFNTENDDFLYEI